jgi:hypothetical protein
MKGLRLVNGTAAERALRKAMSDRLVAVVVGTGISLAATNEAETASWDGLMRSGLTRAQELGASKELADSIRSDLDLGSQEPSCLRTAAEKITDALGGPQSGAFRDWLCDDIGSLEAVSSELIGAISDLGCPILTTNYDHLIEQATGRGTVTWRNTAGVHRAVRQESDDVVHLHGSWDDPGSVILSGQSYGRLAGDDPAQQLQRAMATLRSFLFIGCGLGLDDPNFGALRDWMDETFHGSGARHFRLCTTAEAAELRKQPSQSDILLVPYGESYDDLLPYLEGLALTDRAASAAGQGDASPVAASQRAFEALCDRVRASSVLGDEMRDVESRSLQQLLVPPVLLPVSHEQFVTTRRREVRAERCDPSKDAGLDGVILLVAEENAGLTATLDWLVAERWRQEGSLAPVVVDFRNVGPGPQALKKQIVRELMAAGAMTDKRSDPPACALGIDNLMTQPATRFARVVDEIKHARYPLVVLGCRRGTETDLAEHLKRLGVDCTVRYIGRMSENDAAQLAGLVESPERARDLATRAIEVVRREHLPRTPLTLGLLISVLLHGEMLLGTASETALLDAYIDLLLGRGDARDDTRVTLDAHERAAILGVLAEEFAIREVGALNEEDAVAALQRYFDSLAWEENAVEILHNFRSRRVLTLVGGRVRFAQSSYLHLFAAKRAMDCEEFRARLLSRPLYYAPIIRHYAALTRRDASVLAQVAELLDQMGSVPSSGVSFGQGGCAQPRTIDEVVAELDGASHVDQRELEIAAQPGDAFEGFLDRHGDADPEPFPLEAIEEAPQLLRMLTCLALVSGVLRDSELVTDLELKARVLKRTLAVWGDLVSVMENDEEYKAYSEDLALVLAGQLTAPGKTDSFVEDFVQNAPMLSAAGGISVTLASRKLAVLLRQAFLDEEFSRELQPSVMGALLGWGIGGKGWSKHFQWVQDRHGLIPILRRLGFLSYNTDAHVGDDVRGLEEFLAAGYLMELATDTRTAAGRDQRSRIVARLQRGRALLLQRRKSTLDPDHMDDRVVEGQVLESDAPAELTASEPTADDVSTRD